jgi:hypothetical protein
MHSQGAGLPIGETATNVRCGSAQAPDGDARPAAPFQVAARERAP